MKVDLKKNRQEWGNGKARVEAFLRITAEYNNAASLSPLEMSSCGEEHL